jgi:ABC-type polysaccharide/polyol phosphate export permease
MWHSLIRLLQHRVLIQTLVVRELKARYRGSALGFLWSFIHPLMLLGVYTFVFTFVFQPMRGDDVNPYAIYLFGGLLAWTWFASAVAESANSLVANGNLIKKIIFPAEVLPIVSVLSNGINFLLGLPIYAAFWIAFKPEGLSLHILWLPVVVAVQFFFSLGLGFFFAALTVHYRDVRDLLTNVLTLWFFASPVIYSFNLIYDQNPGSIVPGLLQLNPMTHIIEGYHAAIFTGELIHWKRLGVTGLVALVVFFAGYYFFDRLRDSFAEEV